MADTGSVQSVSAPSPARPASPAPAAPASGGDNKAATSPADGVALSDEAHDQVNSPAAPASVSDPAPPGTPTRDKTGVNIDPQVDGAMPTPDQLKQAGIGSVRLVDIADVHNKKGINYDQLIDNYAKAGIKVNVVLDQDSIGVPIPQGGVGDPNYVKAFAQHAAELAGRHNNSNVSFEIFNEENHKDAKDAIYIPPDQYARLLNSTNSAIKGVNQNSPVIMGGVLGDDAGYVNAVKQANGGTLPADQVGLHPYTPGNLAYVKQSIDDFAKFGKPIAITEIGWEPDQARQAQWVKDVYNLTMHDPRIATTQWYTWSDRSNPGFGLVDNNGNPKQSYYAMQQAGEGLADAGPPTVGPSTVVPPGSTAPVPSSAPSAAPSSAGSPSSGSASPPSSGPSGAPAGPSPSSQQPASDASQQLMALAAQALQELLQGGRGPSTIRLFQLYTLDLQRGVRLSSQAEQMAGMVLNAAGFETPAPPQEESPLSRLGMFAWPLG